MTKVLEIKNLTKKYKNGRGVENITFSIEKGDIFGILGPNGSGKTTTMKAIVGLCGVDSGAIEVFGYDNRAEFEKAMADVGCLIEMPSIYDYLSAYNNLKLAARLYNNVDNERIDKALSIVRLDKYKNDKAGKFSLGMKQRLGIAMALLSEPEFIILDEPANGLDIEGIVEMRELIVRLSKEKGVTFLISSHISSELEKMCNKIAVIYDGELVSVDSIESALEFNPTLEDYFLNQVKERKGAVVL
ncbi:MAG: ABC transporter ATP-binding protein [Oscillospiraceae bacterium]|nr:ABC transporter ATP-binding protein [Oscillospiraceae bacterium]